MRKQGDKSVSGDNEDICMYRGVDNFKCAAGCLITDENYNAEIEGVGVFSRSIPTVILVKPGPRIKPNYQVKRALLSSGVTEESLLLVFHLQRLHDSQPPSNWESWFGKIAEYHKLEYTAVA